MRTVYYQPEPKTESVTLTGNPLIDFASEKEPKLNNQDDRDSTAISSGKVSKRYSPKAVKRHELFEANKDKTNMELIRLLQQQEPSTLFLAAKKAVERWRESVKKEMSSKDTP
jgi:hypothetical protein